MILPTDDTPLPLVVDDWYSPGGFMGDGESEGIVPDDSCAEQRPGEAKGLCHKFTWTPGSEGWAGVFWQYPENNWGDEPGLRIAAGATAVSFYAWGASGGEVVKFVAGMKSADGFEKSVTTTLTNEPKQYEIDMTTVNYTEVTGGFAWFAGDSTSPVVFYLDDIQWR